jgi:hypothetical protein
MGAGAVPKHGLHRGLKILFGGQQKGRRTPDDKREISEPARRLGFVGVYEGDLAGDLRISARPQHSQAIGALVRISRQGQIYGGGDHSYPSQDHPLSVGVIDASFSW